MLLEGVRPDEVHDRESLIAWGHDTGDRFILAALPITAQHRHRKHEADHRHGQFIPRDHYVEFEFLHDRSPAVGLRNPDRTGSVVMSLPPAARQACSAPDRPAAEPLPEASRPPRNWRRFPP